MGLPDNNSIMSKLRHALWFFYPERLRSKITLVVVIGLLIAQILTGTMWSQMRRQVLIETPARIAAVRFSDWYLYAESQLAHGLEIEPSLLSGVTATPVNDELALHYQSNMGEDFGLFFEKVIQERTGACKNFHLIAVNKARPTEQAGGFALFDAFSRELNLVDVSFVAVFKLSDGQQWRLHVVENQGWSSIGNLRFTYDYFLRIYFFRLILVVIALTLCLNFIFRPLKKLEKSVLEIDVNRNQEKIQLGGSKEFKRLGVAFNNMVERLQKHIEERSYFFSAVSHDLRTPITRLTLRVQKVQDENLRMSLNRDVEQLKELVNSTLELMSFQTSEEAFAEVDIAALLTAVSINRQDLGENISLAELEPAILQIQIQRFRRCLENLISNGLRYGQAVYISAEHSADEYIITVADDGPGIPIEEQAKVLRPYYRLETSRNRSTGGYGLGLSICDEVALAHGGRLEFARQQERFCVRIHLPLEGLNKNITKCQGK